MVKKILMYKSQSKKKMKSQKRLWYTHRHHSIFTNQIDWFIRRIEKEINKHSCSGRITGLE